MTELLSLSAISVAYKWVALAVMLAEINSYVEPLGLRINLPLTESEVMKGSHISSPKLTEIDGTPRAFGGSVVSDSYFFGFTDGRLWSVVSTKKSLAELSLSERNEKMAQMMSLIGTNEAYQLATNWLHALNVDVVSLGKKYAPIVEQRFFYPDADGISEPTPEQLERKTLLPIFDVHFGTNYFETRMKRELPLPAVSVSVWGPKKELLELLIQDKSFWCRPKIVIKDFENQLAIPDAEFKTYTFEQKSNLVVRFAGITNLHFLKPTTNSIPGTPSPPPLKTLEPKRR